MPKCAFCGKNLVRGSGLLFVRRDGTASFFCSGKCQKNMLRLKRSPFAVKWTDFYQKEKQAEKKIETKDGGGEKKAAKTGKKRARKRKKKR